MTHLMLCGITNRCCICFLSFWDMFVCSWDHDKDSVSCLIQRGSWAKQMGTSQSTNHLILSHEQIPHTLWCFVNCLQSGYLGINYKLSIDCLIILVIKSIFTYVSLKMCTMDIETKLQLCCESGYIVGTFINHLHAGL